MVIDITKTYLSTMLINANIDWLKESMEERKLFVVITTIQNILLVTTELEG